MKWLVALDVLQCVVAFIAYLIILSVVIDLTFNDFAYNLWRGLL